ncbi:MAG: HPr-rel-A system PqqD family peptide chaperone [Sphingomonadales bacterium]|jgi:PqqD family protein of HPr-rel-A system
MGQRWTALSWSEQDIRVLDGFHVLYEPKHGGTHILSDVPYEILVLLAEAPLDINQLAERLSEKFDLEADGDPKDVLLARVQELDDLGLIIPVI